MTGDSCNVNDKKSSCCTVSAQKEEVNITEHWNKTYLNSPDEMLGWYETDLNPALKLISETDLSKSAGILNAGVGNTTLIDELLSIGYSNLIAVDLSEVALKKLKDRVGSGKVKDIVDDLTNSVNLQSIASVDLWIDRAALHFFTEKKDQDNYFDLLNKKVKRNGFVILAEYNLNGAKLCAGLPVQRYSKEILSEKLGIDFILIDSFEYTYIMPSGAKRPYVYTLFKKL